MSDVTDLFSDNFFPMYAFSCFGALLLWMKSNAKLKQYHSLGDVVDVVFPKNGRFNPILKFVFFIFIGGFVGVLFVAPSTPVQAASAGMAWCRLVARSS